MTQQCPDCGKEMIRLVDSIECTSMSYGNDCVEIEWWWWCQCGKTTAVQEFTGLHAYISKEQMKSEQDYINRKRP